MMFQENAFFFVVDAKIFRASSTHPHLPYISMSRFARYGLLRRWTPSETCLCSCLPRSRSLAFPHSRMESASCIDHCLYRPQVYPCGYAIRVLGMEKSRKKKSKKARSKAAREGEDEVNQDHSDVVEKIDPPQEVKTSPNETGLQEGHTDREQRVASYEGGLQEEVHMLREEVVNLVKKVESLEGNLRSLTKEHDQMLTNLLELEAHKQQQVNRQSLVINQLANPTAVIMKEIEPNTDSVKELMSSDTSTNTRSTSEVTLDEIEPSTGIDTDRAEQVGTEDGGHKQVATRGDEVFKHELEATNEQRVPFSDAPLMGAPIRVISLVARFVSGADLMKTPGSK